MQTFTVIIRDVGDQLFVYRVTAPSGAKAGMHAFNIWSAHSSIGGTIDFVIEGEVSFAKATQCDPPSIINLDPIWED